MPWRPKTHAQIQREKLGAKRKETRTREQLRENGRIWDRKWRAFAKRLIAERIWCEDHAADDGRLVAGEEVHHKLKVKDRPDLKFEPTNCLVLCTSCHSIRTGRGE